MKNVFYRADIRNVATNMKNEEKRKEEEEKQDENGAEAVREGGGGVQEEDEELKMMRNQGKVKYMWPESRSSKNRIKSPSVNAKIRRNASNCCFI